jgi:hypothetical protein
MRRIEDRVRSLCGQLVDAKDDADVRPIVRELREVLRQHIKRLRVRLADYPRLVERRSRNVSHLEGKTALQETIPANSKMTSSNRLRRIS